MNLFSLLFGRAKRRGSLGQPLDWLTLGTLTPRLGCLYLGDLGFSPATPEVFPAAGQLHRVQMRRLDFAGEVRVSALRLVSAPGSVTLGEAVGRVGSDHGGLCALSPACPWPEFRLWPCRPDDGEGFVYETEFGATILASEPPVEVFWCATDFGDGSSPVHRLVCDGCAAGYQVTFSRDDEPYRL